MNTSAFRFLIAGGLAAAINWLARIGLSPFLPFEPAILVAYAIGMAAGFVLYRSFVFEARSGGLPRQLAAFLAVNACGALIVLLAALGIERLLNALAVYLAPGLGEAIAHGLAIGIGAIANYAGHKLVTFAPAGHTIDAHSR